MNARQGKTGPEDRIHPQ